MQVVGKEFDLDSSLAAHNARHSLQRLEICVLLASVARGQRHGWGYWIAMM